MDDPPVRFTQRMTADARKRQIVEVALDLVEKYGLQGVTMARIAAGAGIRQASLYTHFESREAILLAALDAIYERIYASRMTASSENTLQRLREICNHHIELWAGLGEEHHAHLLLEFVAGAPGEGLRETLAAKHLETMKEFAQIVERGKKEGTIPLCVDSEQVAWFITGWAFAGDVSQTMGFKRFLDPEISGRWLDMMFASFVAGCDEPDEAGEKVGCRRRAWTTPWADPPPENRPFSSALPPTTDRSERTWGSEAVTAADTGVSALTHPGALHYHLRSHFKEEV